MPLVVLEGIDGCGKTTQQALLKEHFSKLSPDKVCFYRAPGATVVGEKVREMVLTPGNECVKEAELHLFLAALVQTTKQLIVPALKQNKLVFLDRYHYSTIAYQVYGLNFKHKNFHRKVVENTIRHALGSIEKVVFYFDLPLQIALKRKKRNEEDRIEERGKEYLSRVLDGYHAQLEHFTLIKADMSPEQICKDICRYVSKWKI